MKPLKKIDIKPIKWNNICIEKKKQIEKFSKTNVKKLVKHYRRHKINFLIRFNLDTNSAINRFFSFIDKCIKSVTNNNQTDLSTSFKAYTY